MSKFKFISTPIEGLYVVEPTVFGDQRGYFMETYQYEEFRSAGLGMTFVQDNQSRSRGGVLRGLHFQTAKPQGKLVRAVSGEVFDVAVDLRRNSTTFGQWYGVLLSGENKRQFYIPEGFAHGFLVVSDEAEFVYKCTDYYDPAHEGGIMWNDEQIGIKWPLAEDSEPVLSEKDRRHMSLEEFKQSQLCVF